MPKVQGGMPIVWTDAIGGYGPERLSTAALSTGMTIQSTFCGTAPNELVLHGFSTTGSRLFGSLQLNHDQYIDATGASMALKPHVHWTCSTSPTTSAICEWKLNYVVAKIGQTISSAVGILSRFGSTVFASTGRTAMPASTQSPDFAFRHFVTSLQDISVPSSLCGPSMLLIYNLQLGAASALGQTPLFLGIDVHYQRGPAGTDTEFS